MKVLHVEDEMVFRRMVQVILDGTADVYWARLHADAMHRLRVNDFDVVLYDLGLPDMSGPEGLRAVVGATTSPVIVLSSEDDPTVAYQCAKEGARGWIRKRDIVDDLKDEILRSMAKVRRLTGELRLRYTGLAERYDALVSGGGDE